MFAYVFIFNKSYINTIPRSCTTSIKLLLNHSYIHIYLHAENFMTGYRIVFDRENMVLGWKESNCEYISPLLLHNVVSFLSFSQINDWVVVLSGYDDELTNLPSNRSQSPAVSPAMAVNPEVTSNQSNEPERPSSGHSFKIKPAFAFTTAFLLLLAIFWA